MPSPASRRTSPISLALDKIAAYPEQAKEAEYDKSGDDCGNDSGNDANDDDNRVVIIIYVFAH